MSGKKTRPSPWKCFVVAEQIYAGHRTVVEIAAQLRVSSANVQDACMCLYEDGYVTRVYRGGNSTHWYEYSLVRMPPYVEPPKRFVQREEPVTFGPNPLQPLLDALGWRETVPTGTRSKIHRLEM